MKEASIRNKHKFEPITEMNTINFQDCVRNYGKYTTTITAVERVEIREIGT